MFGRLKKSSCISYTAVANRVRSLTSTGVGDGTVKGRADEHDGYENTVCRVVGGQHNDESLSLKNGSKRKSICHLSCNTMN